MTRSHPSPTRASLAGRLALVLLSLLACSRLVAAAPRIKPAILNNPHPHGPTPQAAAPVRPQITAYPDFDRRLRRKNPKWRENHGMGHAWKRSDFEEFPELFADKLEFARRGLVMEAIKSVVKQIRAPPSTAKPTTTTTRKTSTTTAKPRSSNTTSLKSTTSNAPAPTTSSASSSASSSTTSSTPSSSSSEGTTRTTTSTTSDLPTTTTASLAPTLTLAPCIGSEANASYISSLFAYGGIGYTVELCPGANIMLEQAVFIWWANQTLTTQGDPTGDTRATLTIANVNISCAIYSALNYVDNVTIQNIQVDGARPALGIQWGGLALIEIGGYTTGQAVKNVHAFEPRGWSALHIAEGYNNFCNNAQIINNQIGPSGHAPSGAQQFKRDSTGTYTPGQWADGISLACRNSLVQGNTVTDTTDGGIVIFGALGSQITGNTIIANDRQALGGINLVDWTPFSGAYTGTVVSNNHIISQASLIKLGIAVGTMSWGTDNRTIARTFDGEIRDNIFSSGPTGYFGYSISVAGHENITISGNMAANANFGGVESPSCFTYWFPLPVPQPFIVDPWTTPGCQLQSDFLTNTTLVLPVCRGPKP